MPNKRTTDQKDYPLVSVIRIKYQTLKCDVDVRQLEGMANYIAYVEQVTGEKPTQGEIVGAALEHLFKLDVGFQRWRDQAQADPADKRLMS